MQPLALGGEDTDGNVQPLCHGCHLDKTAEDFPDDRPALRESAARHQDRALGRGPSYPRPGKPHS
ncbi:HNH endonuclease [Streptomyces sp. NPDC056486]|uniref:HNH endonuclease n=1 Tax=Streptomyces sp. NPDC056486 TaxID=3345835 RepID=UPI0036BA3257